jgi:putative membrane-bound dehydrogenase-like protein
MKRGAALGLLLLALACGSRKPPFSPQEEHKSFRLPPGFRIELVAAEPEVIDPVAMTFDEHGRMYVVEMSDYPLSPKALGRIKLLEDRNGDGRYESATDFAEGLHLPAGVMRWRNGILVACAPDILYFEDTNNDGRADVRRVVLTGFAAANPQLRVNGLLYGIDNWVYAAYPRPPVPRRYVKEFGDPGKPISFPDRPDLPPVEIRAMDLRFDPEKHRLEAVGGNSQFGNAFDSWGNRFTLWNNDHIRHVVIGKKYLDRNPFLAVPSAQHSISDHESQSTVYPITQDPFHIHDSQIGHFTSCCGLAHYNGGNLGPDLEGNSFTCEPVHNLVHRDRLAPRGATFVAQRAHERQEFLASTDAWFRPVFTTTGPDGALYVVDFYHYTVEHPEFVPPELLKQIDFEPRHKLGRIWRVLHESSKPVPKFTTDDLVAHFADPNYWRRIQAQRLLVDRRDRSVVPRLVALSRDRQGAAYARLHALWTLDGLDSLPADLLLEVLSDPHARLRENAVRMAETRLPDVRLREKLLALYDDPDARVQFQVACVLGGPFDSLRKVAVQHLEDQWFRIAVLSASPDHALSWLRAAAPLPSSPGKEDLIRRAASIIGAHNQEREITTLLRQYPQPAALEGLADGLRQGAGRRARLSASQPALLALVAQGPTPAGKAALRVASSLELSATPQLRALLQNSNPKPDFTQDRLVHSLGLLGLDPSGSTVPVLARFLDAKQPEAVQVAAAASLARLRAPEITQIFVERWRAATAPVRTAMLAGFFNDRGRLPALLEAVAADKIQAWALGPARTNQLLRHADPAIKARAEKLLGEARFGDRKTVYQKYLPALRLSGNPERGRIVFEKACAECHKAGSTGYEVGPDLKGVVTRYKEALLTDILLPNQQIEGGYEEYEVETTDGRTLTGVLAKETATTLTLRRAKGQEDTVLRASVKSLRSLSVSAMPEDLEKQISVDEMADLIAFIKSLR